MFQQRVHTLEMENSNRKHENKKRKCFVDEEYPKTDELDQYGRKEKTFVFMEFLRTSHVKMMEKESFWK